MGMSSDKKIRNYHPNGVRRLPFTGCTYLQRIPQPDPFRTSWYPVNASKRCVTDENIELINLHYSGTLRQTESNLLDKRTQLNSKKFVVPDNLPRRTRLRGEASSCADPKLSSRKLKVNLPYRLWCYRSRYVED